MFKVEVSKKTFCKYLFVKTHMKCFGMGLVGQATCLNSMHSLCLCTGSRSGNAKSSVPVCLQ